MKKNRNKKLILDSAVQPGLIDKLRKIYNIVMYFNYSIKYKRIRIPLKNKKIYNVAICAIFKNEALYLKEWIEFHRIIGVEHFYLYNNNSDDDYITVLNPYIKMGLITLIQWPKDHAQMECYNDCIINYKWETRWLGFIDIDEFIVPIEMDNIYDFLKPFEKNRGSVKIYWKMFGTSGLLERDMKSLVTEKFTVSWPKYYSVGKCFYNTNFDFKYNSRRNFMLHHMLWASYRRKDIPPVNSFGKVCFSGFDIVKSDTHPIQINHYFTKSYKEYSMKKMRGDVYFKLNPHDEEYFYLHELENISTDYSAYKYLIKLKLAMEQNNE